MFRSLALSGATASIAWGYRTAVTVGPWSVKRVRDDERKPYRWELEATIQLVADQFALRQRPLLFNAPRKGGFFTWPVQQITVGERRLIATLGPPEH